MSLASFNRLNLVSCYTFKESTTPDHATQPQICTAATFAHLYTGSGASAVVKTAGWMRGTGLVGLVGLRIFQHWLRGHIPRDPNDTIFLHI